MKRKSSRRLVRWLGLAIAVAAFAAPAAQAMPVISNEGGMAAAPAPQVLYPDDLHAMLPRPVSSEPVARATQVLDQTTFTLGDRWGQRTRPPVSHVASASTGFDWSYAGIGAVGVFGLMLLGIGVLFAGRHNRRSRLAAVDRG